MMKNFTDPSLLRRIFKQRKRRGLNYISVGMVDGRPNRLQRTMKLQLCHETMKIHHGLGKSLFERPVFFCPVVAHWLDDTGKVFDLHREHSADQISKIVGQVGIVTRGQGIVPKVCVLSKHALAQHEVTKGIHADSFLHLQWRDGVSQALGHFLTLTGPETMYVQMLV